MALIRAQNPNVDKNEYTLLESAIVAAATSLTVQNNEGFAADDYVILEKMGTEIAEIVKIASVSGNTTITTAAVKFAHSADTPIRFIKWNQVRFYRATSKTGTFSLQTTVSIEVDQTFTEWDDTSASTTDWYKISFYNSTSANESTLSDPVQATGYADNALRSILNKIYRIGDDRDKRIIPEGEMVDLINDGYRIAIDRVYKANRKYYLKRAYVDIVNSYETGTVSVTDGATAVTGSSTVWSTGWSDRKIVFSDENYPYIISSFGSSTALTLERAYQGSGSNLSSVAYKTYQDEYTIYDESDGEAVEDFRSIERVIDEDGIEVHEYDLKRQESGYYIKRVGDNLKFCLNFIPATSNAAGRWEVYYIYQPTRFDSMGDTPELPPGSDGILVNYGVARIKERSNDEAKAQYYNQEFEKGLQNMTARQSERTQQRMGWRLDKRVGQTEHDADWIEDVYSRTTIS